MANVNKIVRRRQLALFIALVLGIGAGGAGTWMVSEMNLKKAPPAKAPKGEPAPDMTGVVNQSFDNKVQRSAIAEAQRLNKETQAEIKKLRTEMGIIGRDLKGSQERIRELEDENKLLQTQIEAGKNFDSVLNRCQGHSPHREKQRYRPVKFCPRPHSGPPVVGRLLSHR